jgi:hypothetical protein
MKVSFEASRTTGGEIAEELSVVATGPAHFPIVNFVTRQGQRPSETSGSQIRCLSVPLRILERVSTG